MQLGCDRPLEFGGGVKVAGDAPQLPGRLTVRTSPKLDHRFIEGEGNSVPPESEVMATLRRM
jgi:hypothetical protein